MAYPEPGKTKPMFRHAFIQGLLALVFALFLATGYAWDLIGKASAWILNGVGVRADYVSPLYLAYVQLLDGTLVGFQVLIQCSGLVTVAIFSFIFAFTIGLLRGSLSIKIVWFLLSVCVGFLWNINRLVFVIIIAYYFGLSAFSFAHYILGPFVDFLWVVMMWSLAMSQLRREGGLA